LSCSISATTAAKSKIHPTHHAQFPDDWECIRKKVMAPDGLVQPAPLRLPF
jgi:hypothetical protein